MQPTITVGIPCFNAEETIQAAVESAQAQDWDALEILVVDDDSTDASHQIVAEIAEADSRVRLIRHEQNTGVGGVRRRILEEANGEYVAFFDDDDISDSQRLKRQYECIITYEQRNNMKLVACYASGSRLYPNGYRFTFDGIGSQGAPPKGEVVAAYLLFNERKTEFFYGAGTPACALIARKSTYEAVGSFDENFRRVEDVDFAVRLALAGGGFISPKEPLYTQFATEGSDKSAEANFNAEMKLFEKHRPFLERRKRYNYARCWFRFRFHHFNKEPLKALIALLKCWMKNPWLVSKHFLRSVPRRLLHELRMGK